MITLRKAHERGVVDFGWLQSKHSFSFGHYYDPAHMGFSALRVINDDVITPSAGFDTHGHRDMEIISYVSSGSIEHKDSRGNRAILPAGEFQLMSAGKGILHSEYNASSTEKLKLLQIWIQPNELGGAANYQQKQFARTPGLTTIVTPTGAGGTLVIKQDAQLHQLILSAEQTLHFKSEYKRVYVHLVAGSLTLNDTTMIVGDGASISDEGQLQFTNPGDDEVTALIFELP